MAKETTIRDLLIHSLTEYPDKTASGYVDGAEWSYAQIGVVIGELFRQFTEEGISAGDRVAILSENQPAWSAVYLAVSSYGAIVVPILPDFSGEDVASILAHSEARLVYASAKQAEKLAVQSEAGAHIPEIRALDNLLDAALATAPEDAAATVVARIQEVAAPAPDDTAAIIYTSGTTGHSKGVELSHWNLASNVESANVFAHMKPGERMLSILPLAHTYECTLGMLIPFSRGAQVSYLARPASPSYLMKSLATVRPHLMLAVPLLIEKIVRGKVIPQLSTGVVSKLKQLPLLDRLIYRKAGAKLVRAFGGRLRFFGIGGAPLAADVESVLYRMRFPYAIGYGLTETAPLLAGTSPDANHLRSTGMPTPGVEIRIQEGEIQAKGPNIMKGYYRDPERTAEVFTEDGWFRTGDLGELDEAGRLFVKGRSKTVLLGSSGENIYPEAIESIINQFTGVEESLVTQEGSRLVARVKLDYENLSDSARSMAGDAARRAGDAAGAAADAAGNAADHARTYLNDLRKRLNQRLSNFNRIAEIREQEEPFAKTPTSKIKRYLYQRKHGEDGADDTGSDDETGSGDGSATDESSEKT